MLRHLRLARARGSLRAPNSPVQDRALEVLEELHEMDREKSRIDLVKALTSLQFLNWPMARANFPEYLGEEDPFEQARDEDGQIDPERVDESRLDWGAAGDADEDEALSRWIAQQEQGQHSISVDEMDQMDQSQSGWL